MLRCKIVSVTLELTKTWTILGHKFPRINIFISSTKNIFFRDLISVKFQISFLFTRDFSSRLTGLLKTFFHCKNQTREKKIYNKIAKYQQPFPTKIGIYQRFYADKSRKNVADFRGFNSTNPLSF